MKKLLSIFLCVCVLLSSAIIAVNAENEKISDETAKKIAENSESLLSVYIFLQVDFNKSEVEQYVLDNVEGAKTDADIYIKYYRAEVKNIISPQVQKFVDDNKDYLENIRFQSDSTGLVIADVYAYNIEKIAQYDKVTQISYFDDSIKPVPDSTWLYEDEFLEQYNINKEKLNPEEYSYSELYYHTNDKEEIDWALVDAFYGEQSDADTSVIIGDTYGREIYSGCIFYPFETRYGVYDVKEGKFYDIKDYQNVPGRMYELIQALADLHIGETVNIEPPEPTATNPEVTEPVNPYKEEIVLGNLKDGYQLCYTELAPPPWMKEFSVQYGRYIFRDFVKAGESGHGFYVKKNDEKLMLSAAFQKKITDINEVVSLIKEKLPEKFDFSIINTDDVEKLVKERYSRDEDLEFVGTLGADFELFYSVPGDRALCAWELEFTYGDYTFHEYGGQTGNYEPEDLGLYVLNEGKILNIKEALNKIKVSLSSEYIYDLAEVINSKDLPYSFTVKHNTAWKYEDRFFEQYNFDKENISPEEYEYSELHYHKDNNDEVDWVLVRAHVGGSGDMFTSATVGNRFISSTCDSMPFRTQYGIYSVKEDKFYDIISYKSANIKTEDLEAVLKQHGIGTEFSEKYEGVFLDQYNGDFDIENISPEDYHYSELYYHKNSADEVDWALVEAYVMPCGAMETSATVGNRFIHSFSYYNPFLTKYGIYNAEDNQFYDITSYKYTNVKTEDLEAALRELNIGTEVSEKITPELREILNKKTNIYDNIAEIGIELNIDFNKDGLEHYISANVLGANKDANIFAKHYREEVKKRISAQVQDFIDDNAGNFYEIQYQGDTLGVVIARAYAYNVDKIAEDERVKSIDCGENIQPYNENLWKYEKRYIEQYEMDKFEPNVFGYVYDELYYHQDKDGEIDWALVKGDSGMELCAETDIFVGNLKIHSNSILSPFETGYGVYDVKEDKFYDINDYQNVPGKLDELVSVLKELGIGEEQKFYSQEFCDALNNYLKDLGLYDVYCWDSPFTVDSLKAKDSIITLYEETDDTIIFNIKGAMAAPGEDIIGDYKFFTPSLFSGSSSDDTNCGYCVYKDGKVYGIKTAVKNGIVTVEHLAEVIPNVTRINNNPNESTPNATEPSTPSAVVDPTQPSSTSSNSKVTSKKANPIKVTAKAKTVKAKKLKKKAQKVKAITVKGAQGKVTYKLVKSGITKKIRKLISINSKGVITIKKWKKAKKGTYKIKVSVTAKGNTNYKAKTITKTVKVKIK